MRIIKNFFIPVVAVVLLIVGCVKINIINTEALSPLGNTDDNFKVVSEEFGGDFQEFIKDNSAVKIYIGEKKDGLATVKLYNKEIKLTNDNIFMNAIKTSGSYLNKFFGGIMDKIYKSTETNSEYEENNEYINEDNKSDFDKNVDDFIKNINN